LHHRRNLLDHIRYWRLVATEAFLGEHFIPNYFRSIILPLVHSTIVIILNFVVIKATIVEKWATIKLSLNVEENLLNKVNVFRLLKKFGIELGRDKLLSLVVEVSLIQSPFLHFLSYIRKLVVSYIELLGFEIEAMEVASCKCGHIWLFKVHKGAS
jgi:hypothetical protein